VVIVYNNTPIRDSLPKRVYNLPIMKFYTSSGDDGFTSLLGEGRVPKYHPRPDAVGTIDEATAALGAARAFCRSEQSISVLLQVQRDLYQMMAEAAATPANASRFRKIDLQRIGWLEEQTDAISASVAIPNEFILPGDTAASGLLSLARAIIRRAERKIAELVHSGEIENIDILRYLNRLSSLCFALELLEIQAAGGSSPTLAKE
jgi:cob(I)alamin adenosyltransferase